MRDDPTLVAQEDGLHPSAKQYAGWVELIARAGGVPIETVGRLRSQAPVKPLLMSTREVTPS